MNVFYTQKSIYENLYGCLKEFVKNKFSPIFRYIFGDYLLNLQETNWVHMVDF